MAEIPDAPAPMMATRRPRLPVVSFGVIVISENVITRVNMILNGIVEINLNKMRSFNMLRGIHLATVVQK